MIARAIVAALVPAAKLASVFHEQLAEWAWTVPLRRKPDFVIGEYMDRYWVIPRNRWFNIYLHFIWESDDDRAWHDHPSDSISLILRGGYDEVTPDGTYPRAAGDVVHRRAEALHRLRVREGGRPTISLFIMGPLTRVWGFQRGDTWVPFWDWDTYCETNGIPQRTKVGAGSDAVSPKKLYKDNTK